MKRTFAFALTTAVVAGAAFAAPKSLALPEISHALTGVVDDDHSMPFACSFGTYEVQNAKETARGIEATLKGHGMLVNSGYVHHPVGANGAIVYRFATDAAIQNGTKLSVVCNDSLPDEDVAPVRYFVPHRKP